MADANVSPRQTASAKAEVVPGSEAARACQDCAGRRRDSPHADPSMPRPCLHGHALLSHARPSMPRPCSWPAVLSPRVRLRRCKVPRMCQDLQLDMPDHVQRFDLTHARPEHGQTMLMADAVLSRVRPAVQKPRCARSQRSSSMPRPCSWLTPCSAHTPDRAYQTMLMAGRTAMRDGVGRIGAVLCHEEEAESLCVTCSTPICPGPLVVHRTHRFATVLPGRT